MFKSYSSNEVEVMAEALHRIAAVLERIEGQLENQPKEKIVYTTAPYAPPYQHPAKVGDSPDDPVVTCIVASGSQSGLGPK